MTHLPRIRLIASAFALAVVSVLYLSSTPAIADETPSAQLAPGEAITGAVVDGSGPLGGGRQLDAYQAAAFLQGWLPSSLVVSPVFQDPPAEADRYTMTFSIHSVVPVPGNSEAPRESDSTFIVNYATDGTSAWISLPEEELWPGAAVVPPQSDKWFVVDQPVIDAFEGHGSYVVPESPTSVDQSSSTQGQASSSGTNGPMIIIVSLVLLGVLVAIVVVRRRGSAKI
jgi:hypothetical protein